MKFKVGDKVKVVRCNFHINCSHIGKEYVIEEVINNKNPYKLNDCVELFRDNELELVQDKQFTKSDLKDGDIVTYRNGNKRYVDATNKKIVYIDNHHCLSFRFDNFIEDLTDRARDTEYDIIKVERPHYETVFERKEEILDEVEKRYLRNVIRPFRKDIKNITKFRYSGRNDEYFIKIRFENNTFWNFPDFTDRTMYKNMESDKKYTLEELGL